MTIAPGATETILLRLSDRLYEDPFADAKQVLALRPAEADAFYNTQFGAAAMTEDERRVQRQAFAGTLWSKQFYYYDVEEWIAGDPAGPPPPGQHTYGRNSDCKHLRNVPGTPGRWRQAATV